MKIVLFVTISSVGILPFLFNEGSCQLQAEECAPDTGKLLRKLAQIVCLSLHR